jgi:uncharacterized membrane protein
MEPYHIYREKIISSGDMTTTLKSIAIDLNRSDTRSYSVQFVFTGTSPVGTVYVQGSNDGGVTYTQVTDSILPVSGNSGSCLINVEMPAYQLVQAVYVPVSGTGTMNCYINGKR